MTKEEYLKLTDEYDSIAELNAQGLDTPERDKRMEEIAGLLDSAPWEFDPDTETVVLKTP